MADFVNVQTCSSEVEICLSACMKSALSDLNSSMNWWKAGLSGKRREGGEMSTFVHVFDDCVFVAVLRIRYNDGENEVNLSVEISKLSGVVKSHVFL